MEHIRIGENAVAFLKKYRFAVLILVLGIVLMLLPEKNAQQRTATAPVDTQKEEKIDDLLEDILSQIQGAGKVKVFLTQSAGSQTIYQTDNNQSASGDTSDFRSQTVIITDSDRGEHGLIVQIIPAKYQGAIVVCQGADKASVRLAIVEAVADATGLSTDRITVLKMK